MTIDADLSNMLFAQSWQLGLLIVVVGIAVRLFACNRPHLAHVLWLVVLLKCVTPPLWSSPSGLFSWLQSTVVVRQPASSLDVNAQPATIQNGTSNVGEQWTVQSAALSNMAASETVRPQFVEPTSGVVRWSSLRHIVVVIWCTGCGLALAIALVRWLRFAGRLRRATNYADPQLNRRAQALASQLSLRCNVRVIVTSGRIGPAVIGWLRPTVLLPQAYVQRRTADELTPILAHELIHLRRGDLWIGMLQLLAQSLWWFHPLVRVAAGRVVAEAERCCDEEVIAELGCEPAEYARSLLGVLELKHALRAAPSFPGVRPMDVTITRLERIMKLGHGSRRMTPWWCWMVLVAAALIALPGAALVSGEDQGEPKPNPAPVTAPAAAPSVDLNNRIMRYPEVYEVSDIVKKMRELGAGGEDQKLLESLSYLLLEEFPLSRPHPGKWRELEVVRGMLVVSDTMEGHQQIQGKLEAIRKHGFPQFQINMRVFRGPKDDISNLTEFPETNNSKIRIKLIKDQEEVLRKLEGNDRIQAISAPRIITLDSQTGSFSIEGAGSDSLYIQVRPALRAENKIVLHCQFGISEMDSVEEVTVPATDSTELQTVRVPVTRQNKIQTLVDMSPGEKLWLDCSTGRRAEADELSLILVEVELLPAQALEMNPPPPRALPPAPEAIKATTGVPVLQDIPYLGRLFRMD